MTWQHIFGVSISIAGFFFMLRVVLSDREASRPSAPYRFKFGVILFLLSMLIGVIAL